MLSRETLATRIRPAGGRARATFCFTLFIGGFLLSEAVTIMGVAGAARAGPHRILCLVYLVARGPKQKSVAAKL